MCRRLSSPPCIPVILFAGPAALEKNDSQAVKLESVVFLLEDPSVSPFGSDGCGGCQLGPKDACFRTCEWKISISSQTL